MVKTTLEIDGVTYESKPEVNKCYGCAADKIDWLRLCNPLNRDINCTEHKIIWVKKKVTPEPMKIVMVDSSGAETVKLTTKDTNPKDSVGVKKSPLSVVPTQVIHEIGLGMLEGALKYGRHNYRVAGVRSSVYYDAAMRHLNQWWEGEDVDGPSGLSHVTKAMTTLAVLRDAMLQDKLTDDRPPPALNREWLEDYNKKAGELIDKYPNPVPAYTKGDV